MGIDREKEDKAKQIFERTAETMDESGAEQAARRGERKLVELENCIPSVLRGIWDDVTTMVNLLKDWGSGQYRNVPWSSIAALASAVAYLACPLDVIPDIVPILGYIDDVIVIKLCLELVEHDLDAYRTWRVNQERKLLPPAETTEHA